ncbi:MAG: hypothetical protein H7263_15440 [Candidatus Sericytochromatia bacterium]|nr:hypothetical protein [Candidatus Sericytochromatia bacterium]
MIKKLSASVLLLVSSISLFSCDAVRETFGVANRAPVIASFDYNPKSGITKNDIITFSVVATDPEGKALQYNWASTRGLLTGNTGSTVSWRPTKNDNSLDLGLSNISVIVSDGVMTSTASVNILVNTDNISISPLVTNPSPSTSPIISIFTSPTPVAIISASSTPVATPTASPTSLPTVTPTPTVSLIPTPSATPTVSISPSSSPTPSASPSSSPSPAVITTHQ